MTWLIILKEAVDGSRHITCTDFETQPYSLRWWNGEDAGEETFDNIESIMPNP